MFEDADLISKYTRAQAIEDGFLVDVSELVQEAGWVTSVAVTIGVWKDIENIPPSQSHQDVTGRLWDVLHMGLYSHRGWLNRLTDEQKKHFNDMLPVEKYYKLIMHCGRKKYKILKWNLGWGDEGEYVITIMLPNED